MEPTKKDTYKARAFARLAGVTVRALHHYDHIGLLKPRRTSAGYRAYAPEDLTRLEQIVALKFIGVPLKKIRLAQSCEQMRNQFNALSFATAQGGTVLPEF